MNEQLSYSSGGSITGVPTIRESLDDKITIMSPNDTPLMFLIASRGVDNEYYEWMMDDIATPTTVRAKREGRQDALVSTDETRPRIGNTIMHDHEGISVADQYRRYDEAGVGDQYAYNVVKKSLEMAKQAELNMRWSEFQQGSGALAPQTAGLIQWAATTGQGRNVSTNPSVAGRTFDFIYGSSWQHLPNGTALTESLLVDRIADAWTNGLDINSCVLMAGPAQKRVISDFGVVYQQGSETSEPLQRFTIDMEQKLKIVCIDRYESDFGVLHVALDRYMAGTTNVTITEPGTARTFNVRANNTILALDPEHIERRVLMPFRHEPLAKTHLTTDGYIAVSHGLQVNNPIALFGISNVDGSQASIA